MNPTTEAIKNQILNSIRRYNYIKVKLYLTELVLAGVKRVPPSRHIQWDIKVGKSSVSRTLLELNHEGWITKWNGDSPRQEYYTINVNREYANAFAVAWLDLYSLSKKSNRLHKVLSHVSKWADKSGANCKVG
jgi:DNA-binding HxlR family transcriptional regulator